MKEELKAKWLTALRSGHFTQGKFSLRWEDEGEGTCHYCCMGVLCHISEKGGWAGEFYVRPHTDDLEALDQDLPQWLALLVEIDTVGELPFLDRNGNKVCLVDLNDNAGLTFEQIADLIEHFM